MVITDILKIEHSMLNYQVEEIERYLPKVTELAELRGQLEIYKAALFSHANLEEELLFRQLETYIGTDGVVLSLRDNMGHYEMEKGVDAILAYDDLEQVKSLVPRLVVKVRKHFEAEETVLFPLAEEEMKYRHLGELGDQWLAQRGNGKE